MTPAVTSLFGAGLLGTALLLASGTATAGQTARPLRPPPDVAGTQPPLPLIERCRCSATVFERLPNGRVGTRLHATDVTNVAGSGLPTRDTCAVNSSLDVRWRPQPGATGYRYALSSSFDPFPPPTFVEVGKNVKNVTYPELEFSGGKVFTLGVKGPSGTYTDSTRAFLLNYPPDTWWAGPDPLSPSLLTKPNGEKYVLLGTPIVGSLLSPDSTEILPALRTERGTFLEIWKDSIFVREEGDTVHMNAWLLFHGGGFDRDSPYAVMVTEAARLLPGFPGGPVLEPGPANGSPSGVRHQVVMALTPNGRPSITGVSNLYPLFDPNNALHLPRIGGYHPVFQAGRGFAVLYAVDGNGRQDRRIPDPRELVLKIENGTATPYEQTLRSKVVTFEVNRAPRFVTASPLFRPTPNQIFSTTQWDLRLVAEDDDPYQMFVTPPGGPGPVTTLRRKIRILGKDLEGNDLVYVDPNTYLNQESITVTVPSSLAPGPCVIEVELCDSEFPEDFNGSGRCVTASFAVTYQPTGIGAASGPEERVATPGASFQTLLHAPYPSPAGRDVSVRFSLAQAGETRLELFNIAGQRVRRLVTESLPAGEHVRAWNGEDDAGRRLGAGVYFARLRAAGVMLSRRILLTR